MAFVGRLPVPVILGICLFLTGVAAAAVAPYRGIVAIDGLGMSNGTYAIVLTLGSLGAAVASVLLGHFSDRVHDRRFLVIGCALMGSVAYGLVFLVPTQFAYIVAICVILPFGGALFSQSFSYSRAYYNAARPERAEFMVSALRSLFSLAWVVTPPAVGWVAAGSSIFGVFLVAALALVTCAVMFGLLLLRPETKLGSAPTRLTGANPVALQLPAFRLVGLAGVALLRIALAVHLAAFPLVVTTDLSGGLADVGIAASLAAALEVPFMLIWGYAAIRLPKEPIMIVNGVVFAAYLVLMYFSRTFQEALLLQTLNALSTAALLSITIGYTQDVIKGRLGLSTSLIDVLTVIAGFCSAGLFALFAKPDSYAAILLASGVISFLGAVFLVGSWYLRVRTETLPAVAAGGGNS